MDRHWVPTLPTPAWATLTLEQWEAEADAAGWRYRIAEPPASRYGRIVPDMAWPSEALRAKLWQLSDWRVSSVTGGRIWLAPR